MQALMQLGIVDQDYKVVNESALPGITDLVNEKAVEYAKQRAAELVGMKWVDGELVPNPNAEWRIDDSTREMLRGQVTQGMDEGWSNDRLADEIVDKNAYAFSDDRAEMIARTETAMADVAGNMAGYRESGLVVGKKWITAGDDEVSLECELNGDAGVVGLDDAFPSGASEPPEHPNCRCDVVPVLAEDEE